MSVKQFAAQMKASIEEIKSKGTAALTCDSIIAYLSSVETSPNMEPSVIDIEQYKANLQNISDTGRYQHETRLEVFRSTINMGQSALRSSFLLNGGGAIALLAFISHLAQIKAEKVPEFADCLLPFVFGVLAITVTSGFTYLSQWVSAHEAPWSEKAGYTLNIFCILLGLISYAMFAWGVFAAHSALITYV